MNTLIATAVTASAGGPLPIAHDDGAPPNLSRILHAIRVHLDMEVAFISEITQGRRYFRHVDSREPECFVKPGNSDPVEDSYCQRVVDGRLPELMTDACQNTEALTLPATLGLPVGAHMSVPIRLQDGSVYGTFCCFSHLPNESLNERDLGMMRVLAEMVAEQIQAELSKQDAAGVIERQIEEVFRSGGLTMLYQPIYNVVENRIVGFESLARFASEPYRTPDVWFAEAAWVGRELELEMMAVRLALTGLKVLPADVYISVNASPELIVKGKIAEALHGLPLHRIVVEVTEHHAVERYEDIAAVLKPLQAAGLRIAIDDAGAGYASFRHILNLQPQIVKLDISITRSIDADRSRRALAAALRGFAIETGCSIVAEGIETPAELETLKSLGITGAQGYHLGRPMSVEKAKGELH